MPVLTPDDIEGAFSRLGLPFRFDLAEKATLLTQSVVDQGPAWLSFPTPSYNDGLNLLNLRTLCGVDPRHQPAFFDHPWYLEEPFGLVNCSPGWHTLRTDVSSDTIEQTYYYARSLEQRGWLLPSAVEVVLMLFIQYSRTGEHLLLKKHTWCSDEASLGRMVTVGAFGRNGVFVSGHPPTFASRGLGLCVKLSPSVLSFR
jgi:hypothetical protein